MPGTGKTDYSLLYASISLISTLIEVLVIFLLWARARCPMLIKANTMVLALENKELYCKVDKQGDRKQDSQICLLDPGLGWNLRG